MKIDKSLANRIKLQNLIFLVLFFSLIGLIGWLSTRYTTQMDWTANARKTLSEASVKILESMDGPINITAYTTENNILRGQISEFVEQYARYKSDLELSFVNPDLEPDTVQNLGIQVNGELIIEFDGRRENIRELTESAITNALQRLLRTEQHWIVFLSGHGERSPLDQKNHDLGQFGINLRNKGYKIHTHNPAANAELPDNTALLVIAGPRVDFLPGELDAIQRYLRRGGNLLWLRDPGDHASTDSLADTLGIRFLPGVVVDAKSQSLGISDPSFAVIENYPDHPITEDFSSVTLFPIAGALVATENSPFNVSSILLSSRQSWTETGSIKGQIEFNAQTTEQQGPVTLGLALTRDLQQSAENLTLQQQRIVVIADGDFLANTYLANGGNLNLGLKIVQWLTGDSRLISIPIKQAPDQTLQLSYSATAIIGLGFLIVLPLILICLGVFIWFKRRRL